MGPMASTTTEAHPRLCPLPLQHHRHLHCHTSPPTCSASASKPLNLSKPNSCNLSGRTSTPSLNSMRRIYLIPTTPRRLSGYKKSHVKANAMKARVSERMASKSSSAAASMKGGNATRCRHMFPVDICHRRLSTMSHPTIYCRIG